MGLFIKVSLAEAETTIVLKAFSLPAGLVTLVLVFIFIPVGFPDLRATTALVHLGMLGEIDYIGASLVFATSAFLVSALEEGGTAYAWSSSAIVVLLVLGGVCIICFIGWEWFVEIKWTTKQPIFTLRLMKNRVFMGALLYEILWLSGEYTLTLRRITFLTGATFTVAVIQIPQEWQTVSNCTALEAGTRLLPFTIFYSVGTILAMILTSKLHVPPVFVILLGAALQIISVAVMSCIPVRTGAAKYICEIILGIGVGTNIGVLVQLTPQLIRGKDQGSYNIVTKFERAAALTTAQRPRWGQSLNFVHWVASLGSQASPMFSTTTSGPSCPVSLPQISSQAFCNRPSRPLLSCRRSPRTR